MMTKGQNDERSVATKSNQGYSARHINFLLILFITI